jgi:hypothetical protein
MHLVELKEEIKNLIKENEITVAREKFKSSAGRANIKERKIKIPRITDIQTAATVIHEIAHIILAHEDTVPDYICEYDTERWTINYLKTCNIHIDYKSDYEEYVHNAREYVKENIERYVNFHEKRGLPPRVRKKICKWAKYKNI